MRKREEKVKEKTLQDEILEAEEDTDKQDDEKDWESEASLWLEKHVRKKSKSKETEVKRKMRIME